MNVSKIKIALLASMFATFIVAPARAFDWPEIDTNIVLSKDIGFAQGMGFDGMNAYRFHTTGIVKFNSDWKVIAWNNRPFTGFSDDDHLGAGTYYQGKLFAAMENWHGCGNVTNQSIAVFSAENLQRISVTVVSNYQNEISAVTVAPDLGTNGIVFAASFCDGKHLFEYALPDLNYVKTLSLSKNISWIQGIGYYNKLIYVDGDRGTNADIYTINPDTGEVHFLTSLTIPGAREYEGLDVSQGDLRIAEGATGRLYFYHFVGRQPAR